MSTPITPADIAEMLTDGDNDYHEGMEGWPGLSSVDNVVCIKWTPEDDEGEADKDNVLHFRAVVVEGDETPIVLDWPAELGLSWHDGGDLLTLRDSGIIRLNPRGVDEWDWSPEEALELAAQLAAMAMVRKAAFADQAEAANGGGAR